jgi:capsular polysaccharide biosynthesis protein
VNDNDLNLALLGRLLRHRWPVLALLAVLGGLLGAGASLVWSPGYQSGSKVLLQGDRGKDAQLGEAQIATSLVVLDRTAEGLQWGETGSDLRGKVSASSLDGNVIQIVGTASTPERAQQLTDRATREYIAFSTQIASDATAAYEDVSRQNRERVQKQIDESQTRITALEASPVVSAEGADGIKARDELERARTTLEQGKQELETLAEKEQSSELENALGQASVRVIEPAVLPGGAASPTMAELVAGGALAATLLGLLAHLVLMRSDRRPRAATDIAGAAGAPLLGTVEVTAPPQVRKRFALHDDRRWVVPDLHVAENERARASRCRRALDRLRSGGDRSEVMFFLAEDDRPARTAVRDMVVATADAGRKVSIATEDGALVDGLRRAAERGFSRGALTIGPSGDGADTIIDVCTVDPRRPLVPAVPRTTAVVLVVTSGTRSPWELMQIGAAQTEVGRPLDGVVVVTTSTTEPGLALGKPGAALAGTTAAGT